MGICEYVELTQACFLNYHLFKSTTRLIIFVYYMCALVSFKQYCITVLVTF